MVNEPSVFEPLKFYCIYRLYPPESQSYERFLCYLHFSISVTYIMLAELYPFLTQAVVEFLPPPFWNVNTDTNEEMEVCLVDEDTKDESNSVQFLYYSVQGIL